MTREAEIRQTATEWLRYNHPTCTQDMLVEAFRCGAEWADKHQPNQWISVKDKMPEKFEVVVAYAANGHIENSYWDGHFWSGDFYHTDVVYWMPLPKLSL